MRPIFPPMEIVLNKLVEWLPLLALFFGAVSWLSRWIISLKKKIEDAHTKIKELNNKINEMESRQLRFEDKIEQSLIEINRRIDDCKTSILDNLKVVLQAVYNKN